MEVENKSRGNVERKTERDEVPALLRRVPTSAQAPREPERSKLAALLNRLFGKNA